VTEDSSSSSWTSWAGAASLVLLCAFTALTVVRHTPTVSGLNDGGQFAVALTGVHPFEGRLMSIAASAGAPAFVIVLTLVQMALLIRWGRPRAAVCLAFALIFVSAVEMLLRTYLPATDVGRYAASLLHFSAGTISTGTYPSGHIARIVVFGGFLSASRCNWPARLILPVIVALATVVALDLLATGAHTVTDIIGGGLLGAGTAAAFSALSR
jgi:membrane-associated phospholipid phosphatase